MLSYEEGRLVGGYEDWLAANPGPFTIPGGDIDLQIGYMIKRSKDLKSKHDGYDHIPLGEIKGFLDLAGSWAEEDNRFHSLWRTHLEKAWGPIETVKD